jgi:hypothetical protein
MKELPMTQTELVKRVNGRVQYSLHESELSKYLNGESSTPKAYRALTDALTVLNDEWAKRQKEQEHLIKQMR